MDAMGPLRTVERRFWREFEKEDGKKSFIIRENLNELRNFQALMAVFIVRSFI